MTTGRSLADLVKRVEALEARRSAEAALPSVLICPDDLPSGLGPVDALTPEAKAAFQSRGTMLILLPIGRSALPDSDGAVDPRIAGHRKFFTEPGT